MGKRYIIDAFNYPYMGFDIGRQCGNIFSALFWTVVFCFKYDGVDLQKRR